MILCSCMAVDPLRFAHMFTCLKGVCVCVSLSPCVC